MKFFYEETPKKMCVLCGVAATKTLVGDNGQINICSACEAEAAAQAECNAAANRVASSLQNLLNRDKKSD